MRANEGVVVVGGGLAGLVASIRAARQGSRVTLLESVSELGGRARTRVEEGYCLNMGPHALYRKSAASEVLAEIGLVPDGAVPSQSGALAERDGRHHALPTGFVSLLTTDLLPLGEKLETARFLARLPRLATQHFDSVSLQDTLASLVARPGVRDLVRALVRLTSYGNAPRLHSGGAALEQLKCSLGGVLYLHGGWQSLVDGLIGVAREAGVSLRTGARVRSVRAAGGDYTLALEAEAPLTARAVVLALSPRDVRRLVDEADPLLQRWEETSLPIRLASLDLGLSRLPDPRRIFALGIDEPIYVAAHSATARLAPGEGAVIHASRYLDPSQPEDREKVLDGLESRLDVLQPGWRELVVSRRHLPNLTVVNRLPSAESGGLDGRPGPALPGRQGLLVAGDWVGPRGQLADAAFASGWEAGRLAAARDAGEGP